MKVTFAGMTLIELMATVSIMGLLTVFAIPSFQGLQGRQDLRVTQSSIQSALYRLQQLALAPPALAADTGQGADFDVVGYGLAFYSVPKTNFSGTVTLGNCHVQVTNDFIAVYKFVRFKRDNSDIQPYLAAVNPATTNATTCEVVARSYPQDMYVLPKHVKLSTKASNPFLTQPWLITQSLASVGNEVGVLSGGAGFTDPFVTTSTPLLAVQHTSIKQAGQPLCYGVTLSRYSEAIQITNQVKQGCSNE
jgi:prepilin-type N-terminal cleavage/methylation domain-containing protein